MSGFTVDPDLLASRAVERRLAAARVAAHPPPAAVPQEAFGVIGQVFAGGASDAAAARAVAMKVLVDQFGVTAEELESAAADYLTADAAATATLGTAVGR
jgi:hypothetical protein